MASADPSPRGTNGTVPPRRRWDEFELRPLEERDGVALHPALSSRAALRYANLAPRRDAEASRDLLRAMLADPGASWWAIVDRSGRRTAGFIGYNGRPVPEVGALLAAKAQGRGFFGRALPFVLDDAFGRGGRDAVEAICHPDLGALQRTLRRAGFTQRGLVRRAYPELGGVADACLFGTTRAGRSSAGEPAPSLDGLQPVLRVANVERSVRHYRDRLGFRLDFALGDPPRYARVSLRAWSSQNACLHLDEAEGAVTPSTLYVCAGAELRALHARWRANGVCEDEPRRLDETTLEVRIVDPDGHLLLVRNLLE